MFCPFFTQYKMFDIIIILPSNVRKNKKMESSGMYLRIIDFSNFDIGDYVFILWRNEK